MKKTSPLVSVVIPCYNHQDFIQDSIQSVIDQTYQNIELIIIDDGSKDNSVEKIQEMISSCQKRFVRFEFRTRPNKGLSATLNEAIEWCEGEYLGLLASDDIIFKDKTSIQVDFLEERPKITAVFGGIKLLSKDNNEIRTVMKKSGFYDFKTIIMNKIDFPTATQMIRLSAIKEVGGFDPTIILEDWYMWLKLSQIGQLYYMDEVFACYRRHDNNLSNNFEKMAQGRIDVLNCFKDSPLYDKAMKNILWSNVRREYENNKEGRMSKLADMFRMQPFTTANMLLNNSIKKLRNKN
ncbi:glycosyltransferase [Psychrobacter sp. AH5]|uniref:glycosyltransferase family 2 protein n=1 Tax=Psychrobacter sp. AH5 TaxID=2937433 RepID=UPI003341178F